VVFQNSGLHLQFAGRRMGTAANHKEIRTIMNVSGGHWGRKKAKISTCKFPSLMLNGMLLFALGSFNGQR